MKSEIILELKGITKSFPGVLANKDIDFELRKGEIHALVGENGAGKSTLMKIISGIQKPDEGEILFKGKPVMFNSPRDSISVGIVMVYQHFQLIPSLSVAQNIILGVENEKFMPDFSIVRKKIKSISEKYSIYVDPEAKIWQLSAGEKQRVEIIKALYSNAKVLILDEPTSVLTPQEVDRLIVILRNMSSTESLSVIFVSHKLPEVTEASDRITILRGGKKVTTIVNENVNHAFLVKEMVGKKIRKTIFSRKSSIGRVLCEIEDLEVENDRGLTVVKGINLSFSEGEVLGIAGISGNGQRELGEAIVGLRKSKKGKIKINGEEITKCSPREIIDKRMGFIPEDPLTSGLANDLSIKDNLVLTSYRSSHLFNRKGFLNYKAIEQFSKEVIDKFGVKTPTIDLKVEKLSGGNMQKVILGRELSRDLKCLVVNCPTKGLDVAARDFIWRALISLRDAGVGIIMISDDLDEIQTLSDMIAVMYNGEIKGILETKSTNREEIGLLMMGGEEGNDTI